MTPTITFGELLGVVVTASLAIIGGFWGIFGLAMRNREKHQDERHAATQKAIDESNTEADHKTTETKKELWSQINRLKDEVRDLQVTNAKLEKAMEAVPTNKSLEPLKTAVAEMSGKVAALPTMEYWDSATARIETRIEKRIDSLSEKIDMLIAARLQEHS